MRGVRYTEEQKLKALALIQQDDLSMREISDKLEIGYATLLKWRTEMEKAKKNDEIEQLVEATPALVQRIAKEVKEDLKDLIIPKQFDPEFSVLEEEPAKQELMERPATAEEIIESTVDTLVTGVDGYQRLSTKLQDVAVNLATRIDALSRVTTGPMELQILVESLSNLQTSFFNKNVTNLNILNASVGDNTNTFGGFKNKA